MKHKPTKTLGPTSALLINELLQHDKSRFTISDAVTILNITRVSAAKLLSDLVQREVLVRIKSGGYLILQAGQESVQLNNWPLITHELVGAEEYFISYYSAMRLHGMTTHLSLVVYATIKKRRQLKKVGNITYQFIYCKPEYFFGGVPHWVTKHEKVNVSDLERTILDGLARPELCGGVKEIVRGIWVKQKEIQWQRLVQYASQFYPRAAVKRLGFILEILGCGSEILPLLNESIHLARDYILLDPGGSSEGKCISYWKVRINMPLEELKASIWE